MRKILETNLILLIFSCALGSILVSIWPLPETIALRNILLFLGLVSSIIYLKSFYKFIFKFENWPIFCIALLCLWLLFHILFISVDINYQIKELRSTWVRVFIAYIFGLSIGIGFYSIEIYQKEIIKIFDLKHNIFYLLKTILFFGIALPPFLFFIYLIIHYFFYDSAPSFESIYKIYNAKQPVLISIILFFSFSFAVICEWEYIKNRALALYTFLVILIFLILESYFLNSKIGVLSSFLGFIFLVVLALFKLRNSTFPRLQPLLSIFLVFIALTFIGQKHFQKNPEWFTLISDINTGINLEGHDYWKNAFTNLPPRYSDDTRVGISAYERSAWFTAGLILLRENSLGIGAIHNAFGILASKRWPDFQRNIDPMVKSGSTHSGWLDLALGIGLPGILLTLIPLLVSWYRAFFIAGFCGGFVRLLIPLFMTTYLFSEVAVGHFIEMLFFFSGFCGGITLKYPAKKYLQNFI